MNSVNLDDTKPIQRQDYIGILDTIHSNPAIFEIKSKIYSIIMPVFKNVKL